MRKILDGVPENFSGFVSVQETLDGIEVMIEGSGSTRKPPHNLEEIIDRILLNNPPREEYNSEELRNAVGKALLNDPCDGEEFPPIPDLPLFTLPKYEPHFLQEPGALFSGMPPEIRNLINRTKKRKERPPKMPPFRDLNQEEAVELKNPFHLSEQYQNLKKKVVLGVPLRPVLNNAAAEQYLQDEGDALLNSIFRDFVKYMGMIRSHLLSNILIRGLRGKRGALSDLLHLFEDYLLKEGQDKLNELFTGFLFHRLKETGQYKNMMRCAERRMQEQMEKLDACAKKKLPEIIFYDAIGLFLLIGTNYYPLNRLKGSEHARSIIRKIRSVISAEGICFLNAEGRITLFSEVGSLPLALDALEGIVEHMLPFNEKVMERFFKPNPSYTWECSPDLLILRQGEAVDINDLPIDDEFKSFLKFTLKTFGKTKDMTMYSNGTMIIPFGPSMVPMPEELQPYLCPDCPCGCEGLRSGWRSEHADMHPVDFCAEVLNEDVPDPLPLLLRE